MKFKQKIRAWFLRFFEVETTTLGWYNKVVFYKWMGWWLVFTDQQKILKFYQHVEGFHKCRHIAIWKDCKYGHSSNFNETHKTYEVNGIKWS